MRKTLFAIFALLCIASASTEGLFRASQALGNPVLMNAAVGNNGSIALLRKNVVYFSAQTDLKPQASSTSNMMLGFYTSDTLFAEKDCMDFEKYDPATYGAKKGGALPTPVSYLNFIATGEKATATAILDTKHWSLNSEASAIIATSCTTELGIIASYGGKNLGMLGLGRANNGNKNYIVPDEKFAVYFHYIPDFSYFLVFNAKAKDSPKLNTIKTDQNWQVSGINKATLGAKVFPLVDNKLIFDINFVSALGVPTQTFKNLIAELKNTHKLTCPDTDLNVPNCTYNGFRKDLPTLKLSSSTTEDIRIEPSTYARCQSEFDNTTSTWCTVSFTAISSLNKGVNYITPAYDNYFVLGQRYFLDNYLLFTPGATPTVEVYQGETGADILGQVGSWIWEKIKWYVYGGIALLVIGCLCCCLACGGCMGLCVKKNPQPVYAAPGAYQPPAQGFGQPTYGNPYR